MPLFCLFLSGCFTQVLLYYVKIFGPTHEILVLIELLSNEGSDKSVQTHQRLLYSNRRCMNVDKD